MPRRDTGRSIDKAERESEVRHLDLFSGIGGFALAAKWTWGDQYKNVGHSEIEPYADKVYHRHFPDSPCFGDITKIQWEEGQADLITGGFPCQDISNANNDATGIIGERSGLWKELWRAIRTVRPRYALMENVPALTVRGLDVVLGDIASIGYDAEWEVISAAQVGAFHSRQRIWILAYPQSERRSTIEILSGITTKGCAKKPNEWESFLAIPAGAYHIDEQWKEVESVVCGDDDGLPDKVERLQLHGLGNAIVPQVAQVILEAIKRTDEVK